MDSIRIQMPEDEPRENGTGRLHDDAGQFTEKFEDDDFIDAIRTHGGAAGTSDVADEVGCSHSAAYHRLDRLREEGRVNSRQIGNAVLWEVVENG